MGVKSRELEAFLNDVAAGTPTRGGGSVTALVGARSVALSGKVTNLARGKKGYEDVQAELERIEVRGGSLQERLLAIADEDSAAYELVMSAMRRPRTTDAERAARVEALQAAYREATMVPLETMERCVEALELARAALDRGNRGAFTDVGVAVLLAEAALRGASLNCRVNLASIKDEGFRTQAEARLADLLARADAAGHEVMAIVEGRL